ncbi:hypothetical protein NDI56_03835 [Haloarcula sp. S1CR25-12]|uniref:Halobacterial output domain-containing protein n=1 Tax=Haloarcula saliterrae TaxID=2950534 RepID=A0ABU2F9Q5_9EURY|nr:hypothetical protein [Haloarcula sp. S1CR25-12]MDS0258541.1 hypothetical protein [Haloarcula sp. S1CR25-12]
MASPYFEGVQERAAQHLCEEYDEARRNEPTGPDTDVTIVTDRCGHTLTFADAIEVVQFANAEVAVVEGAEWLQSDTAVDVTEVR